MARKPLVYVLNAPQALPDPTSKEKIRHDIRMICLGLADGGAIPLSPVLFETLHGAVLGDDFLEIALHCDAIVTLLRWQSSGDCLRIISMAKAADIPVFDLSFDTEEFDNWMVSWRRKLKQQEAK